MKYFAARFEGTTKRDRRTLAIEAAKKLLQKAISLGYRLWQPGEIVTMSDRSYLVQKNGAWRRLHPGQFVTVNDTLYQIRPDGRTFKKAK